MNKEMGTDLANKNWRTVLESCYVGAMGIRSGLVGGGWIERMDRIECKACFIEPILWCLYNYIK